MKDLAPAKLNLCLYVGGSRPDGPHELRSIFEPLQLADRIEFTYGDVTDSVDCEGVEGVNIADRAIAALRARAWAHPPIQVRINKRIPISAGLGGGSADAGAVLRYASTMGREMMEEIAAELGADVPSQIQPRPLLVSGAGERFEPIPHPAGHGIVLIPLEPGLSAAEVYAEHDRLGGGRTAEELTRVEAALRDAASGGESPLTYSGLLTNDLEAAALSLRPEISQSLDALRQSGAALAMVSGSGPTAFGLFSDFAGAERAVRQIQSSFPRAIATAPVPKPEEPEE